MAALQERQEKILQQLNDLKQQIDGLKGDLKCSKVEVKQKPVAGKVSALKATVDVCIIEFSLSIGTKY